MNPLLQKTQDAILQKADPRLVPVIKKLEAAGQQVMYSEKSRGMMIEQLGDGKNPEQIGAGVAKLIGIIYSESKKTAPMEALIPASVLLLCEGLNFLEEAGAIQVSNEFLSQCTMAMGSSVAQLFGATPEKLQTMISKGQGGGAADQAPQMGAQPPAAAASGPATGGILANAQGGM